MPIRFHILGGLTFAMMTATASFAFAQGADVKIAVPVEPANIDGCNTTVNGINTIVKENIVETLTVLDPNDSKVLPRLATKWEDQGNGTWRISLREGVGFHDGKPFNADAVVKAITRMQGTGVTCLDRTKIANVKLTATAVDDKTVDIHADPAQVLMPVFLSFMGITGPDTSPTELSRAPVGTGPFQFVSWDGDGVKLKRNDNYWGKKPEVENATYVFRGESALRAAMVKTGEADIAFAIAPQDADDPKMDKAFLNGETTRIRFVMQPPLDDIRIRQALNLGLDRQALIGTVLSDKVVPATQFILPKINGYNPDLKVWPYDPDKAAALVAEAKAAGVPVDKPIRLIGRTNFFANEPELLEATQQMWQAIGLNVKVEMMESAEWLKLVNKPYPADRTAMMIQEMHDNNNGDAAFTMYFRYHSKGQQSEMNNPQVDGLIDKAMAETGEQRTKDFQEANRIIADEVIPAVPQYHMVSQMRVGPRVNYEPNGLSTVQFELSDITLNK